MTMDSSVFLTLAQYMTVCVVFIVVCWTILGSIAFWKSGTEAGQDFLLTLQPSAESLKVFTIGGIVIAAAFLAFAGVIEGGAVTSILSGIAGYVLGTSGRGADRSGENDASRRSTSGRNSTTTP